MSNRHPYEEEAIASVIAHLNRTEGREYRKIAEHVPSGARNCDYLLESTDGQHQVAVELVRLFDDPESMAMHRKRSWLWRALREECAKRGISGFIVRTPYRFDDPPRELTGRVAKRVAAVASTMLESDPKKPLFTVDGFEFKATHELVGVAFAAHAHAYWVDREGLADRHFETVVDKDAQVAIPNAKRLIAAVRIETALDAGDLAREFASRDDLNRLLHADQVVIVSGENVTTVYSRRVRDYLEGASAFPADEASTADFSLQSRLASNVPGTFELLRAHREQTGSLQLLTTECRRELARHGDHLAKIGRHEDASWIARELLGDPDPDPDNSDDAIVTVRGSVAFLIEKLVASARVEEVSSWLPAVQELAKDPHRGVRKAAVHPLNVLLDWRDELRNGQPALDSKTRRDLKRLWLEYVDASLKDGDAEAAAETLRNIQHDLSVHEVFEFVGVLRGRDLGDALEIFACFLIYFAFLRSSDPGLPKAFDDIGLRAQTAELARENPDLARTLAYVTRNSARDHSEVRQVLGPLLTMLLETPQDDLGLTWALEAATFMAEDGLLTADDGEAICSAVRANRPSPEFRAWGIADALKDLLEAVERRTNGFPASALLAAVTDPATADRLNDLRAT